MLNKIHDWVREFFIDEPSGVLQYGLIKISQEQMAELVRDKPCSVAPVHEGFQVNGLERAIFVPLNQPFRFRGRDTIFVQRIQDVDVVLDRMEARWAGDQ